jgi:SAM-dependent methyltransferase
MDPLRTPLESSWGGEIHYVCFNDECGYYCGSWEILESQGIEDTGYRCRMDPRGECGPLPVWSADAMKDLIVADDEDEAASVPQGKETCATFVPQDFAREDDTPDTEFYKTFPGIAESDSLALSTIEDLFVQVVPKQSGILDLMAGRDSHLKPAVEPEHVTGLGLDEKELAANEILDSRTIYDLNSNTALPFEDNRFDAVINTLSVEYLTNPVEIFREVGRVLKPGGLFIVVFSNRMFPPKAVNIWKRTEEACRVELVKEYFASAGIFSMEGSFQSVGKPRPRDDKYYSLGIPSDPIYALWASVKK